MWICNSVVKTYSYYWNERFKEFKSFGHFFLSMLQNFLGSVIDISNVYRSIEENLVLERKYQMHYDIARIVRILTIFEPVELKDPNEFDYDDGSGSNGSGGSGGSDADSIPDPDVNKEGESPFADGTTTETGFRPRSRLQQEGAFGALVSYFNHAFHPDSDSFNR